MVVYVLYIKADLEGLLSLAYKPGADICISVRNPTEATEVRERIVIDPSTLIEPNVPEHDRHRSEIPYHLALKWSHGEEKRANVRILHTSNIESSSDLSSSSKKSKSKSHTNANEKIKTLREMKASDSGHSFVPFLAFDCDGLEPYMFHPTGNEFIVTTNGNVALDNIEMNSDGDWSYYDMTSGSASVTNFISKFE